MTKEYIEREAVFRTYIDLCTAKSKLAKARKGAAFFQSDLLPETELTAKEWSRLVAAVPAADVAPVVHGRWEEKFFTNERQRVCSVCHCTVRQPSYDRCETALFKYCPHCGARMDGDTHET